MQTRLTRESARFVAVALVAAGVALSGVAEAQIGKSAPKAAAPMSAAGARPPASTPAAAPVATTAPGYEITGFRGAKFGMTSEQVRASITADFGLTADKISESVNPQDRTTSITATVPGLDPGPGPAVLTYILGATSHRLIKVGVVWLKTGTPTAAERGQLVSDGLILSTYFQARAWPQGGAKAGVPLGPNALALFIGQDAHGAIVEVDVQGVQYDRTDAEGKKISSPTPTGAAALVVAYTADARRPDVYRLPPGSF